MINAKIRLATVATLTALAIISGCHDKPVVASPACVELETTTDPAKRADLIKKCPRGGPNFKPSEPKSW